ncbi:unnamed protein product [Microthlaspi erraticum]|uniref:F-box domain-containing protein n=1 Tax=Microthlaspi erraticum TaxID=1685480 RepID=A0A6D2KRD7_9BRAS|nr:unnamed protein product [Microthlaspi erraticum]
MASSPLALAQSHCWSELPLDLKQTVFERLGFTDFERAKSVCSSWQSGSRQSQPNNQIPWILLFPVDKNHCLLLNPQDKEKVYKTQHLGDHFGNSFCCKTYRSWLLMQTCYRGWENNHTYILNVLTHERINLPTTKTLFTPQLLWIDEKTKDYLVIGNVDDENLISFKKGDSSWREILLFPDIGDRRMRCHETIPQLVYKDDKVVCLNFDKLHVFDFSRDVPVLVFTACVKECVKRQIVYCMKIPPEDDVHRRNNVVVTLGGDILIVTRELPRRSITWNFNIFKMTAGYSSKWEEVFTLGDEAILLELGITVLAKDLEGITSNSIYFCEDLHWELDYENDLYIYNLDTKMVEQPQRFVSSSDPFSNACWFLPSFKRG